MNLKRAKAVTGFILYCPLIFILCCFLLIFRLLEKAFGFHNDKVSA